MTTITTQDDFIIITQDQRVYSFSINTTEVYLAGNTLVFQSNGNTHIVNADAVTTPSHSGVQNLYEQVLAFLPDETLDNRKEIADSITQIQQDIVSPYLVYTALLTQSGTNAPTVTILNNTLGFEPSWQYDSTGYYYIQNAAFAPTLTYMNLQKQFLISTGNELATNKDMAIFYDGADEGGHYISIFTGNVDGAANGILNKTSIEIKVY
jgi:hypothetical protein